MGWLDHKAGVCLTFEEIAKLFTVLHSYQVSPCFPALALASLSNCNHLTGVLWCLIMILTCIFLMTNVVRLICHTYIFFGEMCVFRSLLHFPLVCLFSYYWVWRGLYMFRVQYLCQKYALQIFVIILWVVFLFSWLYLPKKRF